MAKCVICGRETGSNQDTCCGSCWIRSAQQEHNVHRAEYIELGLMNIDDRR